MLCFSRQFPPLPHLLPVKIVATVQEFSQMPLPSWRLSWTTCVFPPVIPPLSPPQFHFIVYGLFFSLLWKLSNIAKQRVYSTLNSYVLFTQLRACYPDSDSFMSSCFPFSCAEVFTPCIPECLSEKLHSISQSHSADVIPKKIWFSLSIIYYLFHKIQFTGDLSESGSKQNPRITFGCYTYYVFFDLKQTLPLYSTL